MGGKSLPLQPIPRPEESEGSELSSEEDSSDSEDNEQVTEEAAGAHGHDAALEVESGTSQLQTFADYETELPAMEPVNAEEDVDDPVIKSFGENHIYTTKDIPKFVVHQSKKIHVSELQWDKNTSLGQIRALSPRVVDHLVTRLLQSPPRRMIRVLVRETAGILSYADSALTVLPHRWALCAVGRATHQCSTPPSLQEGRRSVQRQPDP